MSATETSSSTITGVVENGVIKLPEGVSLPDGTKVTIRPEQTLPRKTFAERYAKYIGMVKDAPSDLAENHDHYLYGTPKRTRTE
jgi:predicted DNA-binding antitoxin AbrB/MazE fold protein